MSSDRFLRILTQRADLKRITAAAYDATPVDSAAVDLTRDIEFYAQVVLTGFSDGIGSVNVIGTNVAGTSISTLLSFTGNQRRMDPILRFSSFTYVNTAGLTNESTVGNVQVNSVSRVGQPVEDFTTIRINIPVRFSNFRADEKFGATGGRDDISGKVYVTADGDFDRRDKIVFRGDTYNIVAIRKVLNREQIRSHRVLFIAAEGEL